MLLDSIPACILYTYDFFSIFFSHTCFLVVHGHLQEAQKQESNLAVKQHLELMEHVGAQIANAATAKDVDVAMRQILDSQMALTQEGFDKVVSVNQSVQATLADVCMLPMLLLVNCCVITRYSCNATLSL
jgi:hypothetical protein